MTHANEERIRVMLVDDHAIVRTGLAAYLGTEPGIEVVAEAANGREALARIAALHPAGEAPDVVLMDLQMPQLDGVETTAQIKASWPEIDVIAVTSFVEESRIRAALQAGATGYLLKDADASDVVDAIRAAMAGEVRLDPAVAAALAASLRTPPSAAESLTAREREVVILVAEGATNREIGKRLGVAERTARTHVSNILAKLDLASRTQAAMWAVREGLVSAEDGRYGEPWRPQPSLRTGVRSPLRSTSMPTGQVAEPLPPASDTLDAQLLALFFDRTPMGVAVFGTDMRLQRCNKTWVRFYEHYLGVPAEYTVRRASTSTSSSRATRSPSRSCSTTPSPVRSSARQHTGSRSRAWRRTGTSCSRRCSPTARWSVSWTSSPTPPTGCSPSSGSRRASRRSPGSPRA